MNYGICNLSIVPVRKEPSDKSEMVSQLLFGETCKFIARQKQWCKITCLFDNYEGWIDEKQCLPISDKYFQLLSTNNSAIALDIIQSATQNKHYIPIVIGSSLPHFDGINFRIDKEKFIYNGQAIMPDKTPINNSHISKFALKYLNAPYLWGGRSPFGIDCSGFTQMVYKLAGISLNRDTYQQVKQGKTIDFTEQACNGDLAFFENNDTDIIHTGIIFIHKTEEKEERKIIHASGKVRIDAIDHYGIFNESLQKYTHKLKVIKRLF